MKNKTEQFDVPILFIIFRRKDTALQVINAIAKVKPKKLYISQDGPRNKAEEKEVLETRKSVLSKINWKCDLTVWTHDKNLGLKRHIPEAFDKLFTIEKYCIYLEDDTVPNKDFFYFQKIMLNKYFNDPRIFYVEGSNLYPDLTKDKNPYFLTQMGNVWGFGIWDRSWKLYDRKITNLNDFTFPRYKEYLFDKKYLLYLKTFLTAVKKNKLDSWAFQLDYTAAKNKMYFIEPVNNLIKNVGFKNNSSNAFLQNYENKTAHLSTSLVRNLNYSLNNKTIDRRQFGRLFRFFWPRILLVRVYFTLPVVIQLLIRRVVATLRQV